ncbi:predicted protein [Chaetomium globosum CBS 148.51]|uniref:Uncharacterized protein n=1 Tax=Chaetomium globosum (strain ATCC 6205 / CBS 148.51 / DSM 1962 / NBRC 6347 / NRRL 1970) TaxID=306901 RepID=Q2H8P8_CHAGB|nr:uncharacterized protein CHGG_03406 [Chaetomium globosum CBS 148.51]EAQ91471.1 predicted protein [Chaetomium globosum CBS 148.51]
MSEGRVLGEMLETLQRLETRIDGQKDRLDAIELSIRSGGASSMATSSSIVNSDHDSTAAEHLHECPSPITPPSAEQPTYPASVYRASIAEMRKRFEFVDASCSDVHPMQAASPDNLQWDQTGVASNPNQDEGYEHEVVYTESAYSRPLSRLDLGDMAEAPPLPNNIQFQTDFQGRAVPSYSGEQHHEPVVDTRELQTSHSDPAHTQDEIRAVRYEDVHFHSIQAQKETSQTTGARPDISRRHEHVEVMYLAWDNFKTSLRPSWWLFSSEHRAALNEKRRLGELCGTGATPRQRLGEVLKWYKLAIKVIRRTKTRGLGKGDMVSVVQM